MPPMYIDGRTPVAVTSMDASVSVTTPYLQEASGTKTLAVPAPANNDTLAILTAAQTMSAKTLVNPVIQGGSILSATLTQPVITSGVLTSPTIAGGTMATSVLSSPVIAMTGGQMSGGIANYLILGSRTIKTAAVGATKTLDFSTADVFIVPLTAACTLTISNAATGKAYQIVVQQSISNSYTGMSWMTGFINGFVDSGPTQRTGAIDFYQVTYDGTYHYGIGAKDIQ